MTPAERRRSNRIAAYVMHSKHDAVETTAAARKAFENRFLEEVDPTGELRRDRPEEAARRALSARKAYFARLSFAAARARSKKKAAKARTNKNAAGLQAAAFEEPHGASDGLRT